MIYNNSDDWVGKSIENYGEYSESEVELFREIIKPNSCVVDIGANIGSHTLAFSRIVGEYGHVYAFEPEKNNFYALAGNIAINNLKNVSAHQMAVGNTSGSINVPVLDLEKTSNFGSLSLCHQYENCSFYPVPLITLDSQNPTRVDFIKMDIEGMELEALQGSIDSIEKFRPIMYIEDDREDKHDSLLEFIKSLNYVVYKHAAPLYNPNNYFGNDKNLFSFIENDSEIHYHSLNLFCYPSEAACPIDPSIYPMEKL